MAVIPYSRKRCMGILVSWLEGGRQRMMEELRHLEAHPPPPPYVKPAGMLLGLDITQPHLPWLLSGNLHHWLPLSWPTWGLFDLIVGAGKLTRSPAGRELLDAGGVGEVEQASVERLNNCINIGGSPRTHAYTAEGGGGAEGKAFFLRFKCSALIFSFQLLCF